MSEFPPFKKGQIIFCFTCTLCFVYPFSHQWMLGFLDCHEQSSVNTAVQIPLPDPAFSSFTTQFYLQRNNITFFVFFFFWSFTLVCPFSSEVGTLLCLLDSCSLSYPPTPSLPRPVMELQYRSSFVSTPRGSSSRNGDGISRAVHSSTGQSQLRKDRLPSLLQPRSHLPLPISSPSVSPLSLSFIPYSWFFLFEKCDSEPCALRPLPSKGCVEHSGLLISATAQITCE